jgi:hypothetical protein
MTAAPRQPTGLQLRALRLLDQGADAWTLSKGNATAGQAERTIHIHTLRSLRRAGWAHGRHFAITGKGRRALAIWGGEQQRLLESRAASKRRADLHRAADVADELRAMLQGLVGYRSEAAELAELYERLRSEARQ